jgi:hypothetical protein
VGKWEKYVWNAATTLREVNELKGKEYKSNRTKTRKNKRIKIN